MFKGEKSSITRIFGKPSGKRSLRIFTHALGRQIPQSSLGEQMGPWAAPPHRLLGPRLKRACLSFSNTAFLSLLLAPTKQPHSHLLHLQITNHNARAQAKGKGPIHGPSQTSLQQSRGRLKGRRASHGEDFAGKADPTVGKPRLHCGAQSQSDGQVYPCLTWMPGLDSGCT